MNAELDVLKMLRQICRTCRANRTRPELAAPAAEWEIKINEREAEILKQETPELAGLGHKKAA